MIAVLFLAAFPCEPSPEERAKIDALETFDAVHAPRGAHAKNVVAQSAAVAKEFPSAMSVEYLAMFSRMYDVPVQPTLDPLLTRFFAALNTSRKEREKQLEAITKSDPTFPQGWQKLAGATKDPAIGKLAFDKARALCPLSEWTLENLGKFGRDRMPALAKEARAAVDKMPPSRAARLLPALWKLELANGGSKGLPAARSRIEADLKRLGTDQTLPIVSARVTGLELLGQNDEVTNDTLLRLYPYSEAGNEMTSALGKSLWAVPKELRAARARELLTKYPSVDELVPDVFRTLVAMRAATPDTLEVGKRWVAMARDGSNERGDMPPQLAVARGYLALKIGTDLVPGLLDEAETLLKKPIAGDDAQAVGFLQSAREEDITLLTLARVEVSESKVRWAEARRFLAELDKRRIPDWAKQDVALVRARSLRAENKLGDALVQFLAADQTRAQPELASLWAELGGSPEALAALKGAPTMPQANGGQQWTKIGKPVAAFTVKDIAGKTWTLKDFAGKRVLLNLWASWCAPCKLELPHLAALAKLGNDKGLLVLTINVDEDVADAQAYLAQHPLDIPVLIDALSFARGLTDMSSIPRSLLIDKNGTLTHELVGFRDSDTWVNDMLVQLNSLAP